MTTMALSMICNTLIEASFAISSNSMPKTNLYNKKVVQEAYAFIQGTGLEVTIKNFNLDLNADRLRSEFHKIFHARD